jgi:hypothetical protein
MDGIRQDAPTKTKHNTGVRNMFKPNPQMPKILLVAVMPLALAACAETANTTSMASSETDAVIGMLGNGCKNRVLEQFDVPNSDITVRLGATSQQDIASGSMTAEDLKQAGASFDWEVAGRDAKGYCNVDGAGRVTEFQQW